MKKPPQKGPIRASLASCFLLCLLAGSGQVLAEEPREPAEAHDFSLPGLDGAVHSLRDLKGRPALLLFGEIYNKSSVEALNELSNILKQPALEGAAARIVLILGSQDPTEKLGKDWQELKRENGILVLHDRQRTVFESHGVKVLPTVMLLDGLQRPVLTVSGYPLNFSDVVSDGLLFALGKIERGKLDKALHPEGPAAGDEGRLKAIRTARMAVAFARRKLYDLAVTRFEEARKLDPTLTEAIIGLADVELSLGKVQESQAHYDEALAIAPASVAAHLGLAKIEIKRDQLDRAEKRLKEQVALHPLQAELHFLLGEAYEKRGKKEEALSAYKRAAYLLLERAGEP